MAKRNLYADTVLRRDGNRVCLMNRKDHGWSSYAISLESEAWFLEHYNARLGEWSRDQYGDYCPVTRLECDILEGPSELEAFKKLMGAYEPLPRVHLVDDGERRVVSGRIETHDGVLVLRDLLERKP